MKRANNQAHTSWPLTRGRYAGSCILCLDRHHLYIKRVEGKLPIPLSRKSAFIRVKKSKTSFLSATGKSGIPYLIISHLRQKGELKFLQITSSGRQGPLLETLKKESMVSSRPGYGMNFKKGSKSQVSEHQVLEKWSGVLCPAFFNTLIIIFDTELLEHILSLM